MKVISKYFRNLTKEEIKSIYRLTIKYGSEMRETLKNLQYVKNEKSENPVYAFPYEKIWMIYKNGKMIGWSIAHYGNNIMLYVKTTERRKGYGKKLYNYAKNYLSKKGFVRIRVYKDHAYEFFKAVDDFNTIEV